jgi:hypothetical protein
MQPPHMNVLQLTSYHGAMLRVVVGGVVFRRVTRLMITTRVLIRCLGLFDTRQNQVMLQGKNTEGTLDVWQESGPMNCLQRWRRERPQSHQSQNQQSNRRMEKR